MNIDKGTLARIDRKLLAGLGDEERYRMVRLPVAEATWSPWKRQCDAAGIAVGRAIVPLINQELGAVVGETDVRNAVFGQRAIEQPAERQADPELRKRRLEVRVEQLRVNERQLRIEETQI